MGYTLPSACIPSGNMAAIISPTSLPKAAPVHHSTDTATSYFKKFLLLQAKPAEKNILFTDEENWHEGSARNRHGGGHSGHPELKRGQSLLGKSS